MASSQRDGPRLALGKTGLLGRTSTALSKSQVEQYFDHGSLIVEDLLTPDDLRPVMAEIDGIVDDVANRLYSADKIKDLHAELDLLHRLAAIEAEWKGAAVLIHINGWLGPELARLWSATKQRAAYEQQRGLSQDRLSTSVSGQWMDRWREPAP